MAKESFPLAMPASEAQVTAIGHALISEAIEWSRRSPRGRIICPFHKSEDDNLQRMLNVIQPHSYAQPHRHRNPPKAESIVVIRGTICYVAFDDQGQPDQWLLLGAQTEALGVDTQPGVYHSFFALEADTVLFEVKPGPYDKATDKEFASWAPQEGTDAARAYLERLYQICGEKTGRWLR